MIAHVYKEQSVRPMIVIASLAALVILLAGVLATRANDSSGTVSSADATMTANARLATSTIAVTGAETPTPTAPAQVRLLQTNKPERGAPINNQEAVRAYYSDSRQVGQFIIAWRPGAFPDSRREIIAQQAQHGLDYVNRTLATNDDRPITIYLADQMYLAEDCHGCQGYAFSDLRHVYLLQDGSLADDEFQFLLTHEIGHVIAGSNIELPHIATLFQAEGLATYLMTPDLIADSNIEPKQIAAWSLKAGILPSLNTLRQADFDGRTRARNEYDPAGSFVQYLFETYGVERYKMLYKAQAPEDVFDKSWTELDQDWRAWLAQWQDQTVNGVDGTAWWNVSQQIIKGFDHLYDNPDSVSAEQYGQLATARVALNRGDLQQAQQLINASGLGR